MMKTLWIFCLGLAALLASCGDSNFDPKSRSLSIQESQRYFPFNDGNLWVSKETVSTNGTITENHTWVTRSAGTKLVGNVIASVMSEADVAGGTVNESYILNDATGITDYGNNSPSDALTVAANPYPYKMVNFPIQVGESFKQFDKTGLDSGHDLDGDGKNELLDITLNVVVQGFESVTTAAGTFQNCLRIETNINETVTFSYSGTRAVATGVETDWYAQDIGPVKRTFAITGNGQSTKTSEELTGYLVGGRSKGLSLKASLALSTIKDGETTQLIATLLDSTNSPLMIVPAIWSSDNSAVATVDANGLASGNRIGTANLTPSVGGVTGKPVTINILLNFKEGVGYPGISSSIRFGDTAIGDLNGDGRNDVAVLEPFGSHIHIYYQSTSGTMNQPQLINTDLNLRGITVRDVNNDGLADLIASGISTSVTSGWKGRVLVFKHEPATHTLSTLQEYVLSTNNAGTLSIADLNNDGLPDVVVASAGTTGGNGQLSFLFQSVNGELGTEVAYNAVPVAATATAGGAEIHVADMNNDGLNDIVVQSGLTQLAVIKQVSPGIFSTTPDYYTVQTDGWPYLQSFALGDLNGDGRTDIAVAGLIGKLNIFLQNADGKLLPPQVSSNYTNEVKIFDIDGDGLNDLLFLDGRNNVMILKQTSTHTLEHVQTFLLPTKTDGGTFTHQAMSVGDVTGDGLPDIVASWSYEGIYVLPR